MSKPNMRIVPCRNKLTHEENKCVPVDVQTDVKQYGPDQSDPRLREQETDILNGITTLFTRNTGIEKHSENDTQI